VGACKVGVVCEGAGCGAFFDAAEGSDDGVCLKIKSFSGGLGGGTGRRAGVRVGFWVVDFIREEFGYFVERALCE
jgi:hypothetical protein